MSDVRLGLDSKDYKYLRDTPDPEFSPERNQAVINETIRETEQWFTDLYNAKDVELENRVDILSSYARYRFNVGTKDIKGYLGDKMYKAIIGEKLLSKLRVADVTNRLNGNNRLKKGILL